MQQFHISVTACRSLESADAGKVENTHASETFLGFSRFLGLGNKIEKIEASLEPGEGAPSIGYIGMCHCKG